MKRTIFILLTGLLCGTFCMAQNPIVTTSYTPDPAPFVHGETLYMFTGHDEDDATYFKMNDWQPFSTEDMVNWTYLGTPISTAPSVDGPWTYRGRIMDEAENSFTIHGGEVSFKGRNYMFYHNGKLPNGAGFHRSAAVEQFEYGPDGSIPFTEKGPDPVGTLDPYERVEAETMAHSWGLKTDRLPGKDHYVRLIHNGDWIRLREVDFGPEGPRKVTIGTLNFMNPGTVEFYLDAMSDALFAKVSVDGKASVQTAEVISRRPVTGRHDVYILFRGGDEQLFDFDWWKMER